VSIDLIPTAESLISPLLSLNFGSCFFYKSFQFNYEKWIFDLSLGRVSLRLSVSTELYEVSVRGEGARNLCPRSQGPRFVNLIICTLATTTGGVF